MPPSEAGTLHSRSAIPGYPSNSEKSMLEAARSQIDNGDKWYLLATRLMLAATVGFDCLGTGELILAD